MIDVLMSLAIVVLAFAQVMTCFTVYLIGKKIDSVLHLITKGTGGIGEQAR